MPDPILSPDGKFMWSGSEWIPAPPTSYDSNQSLLVQDSVVSGEINVTQNIGPDAKESVASMLNELDKFDTSQSGFHIPDGGFSATSVINAINPIKANISILQSFSTEHLLEFCTALETIGYSEIGLNAVNIILGRAKSSQNKDLMAKAYILKSEFLECLVRNKDSLSHAIEAAIISKELGNTVLESEALYLVTAKSNSARKDHSNFSKRIDELLSDTSLLDYSSYAYLLTAKAQVIKYTDPNHSEVLEQQALKYAKDSGDVRLQVYVHLHMIGNEIIVPTKSDTDDLRRLCAINGMKTYTALLDMVSNLKKLSSLDKIDVLSSKMRQLSDELEVPYYGLIGEIFFVCGNLLKANNACMETGDTDQFEPVLNDERVVNLFQKCIEQDIYELDDILLYALFCIRSTAYLISAAGIEVNMHSSIKNYTMFGRDKLITDEEKFIFKIIGMIDRNVPIDQLTHICLPSGNDSDGVSECKELISQNIRMLKDAASEAMKETSEERYIQQLEESTLDITNSYNSNQNSEFAGGLLKLVWGVILCIVPFILIAMTDGMIIWWGLWIWGGIEILLGLSKMFGD